MMAYDGQPVPSTTYQNARAKVSDGKSIQVTVPAGSGDITVGDFCYFDGFLGEAMQSLENDAEQEQSLVLRIEEAIYETDQLTEGQDFNKGTEVYWDADNKVFTETEGAIYAGIVAKAKDANGVAYIKLRPQKNTLVESVALADAQPAAALADVPEGDQDGAKASAEIGLESNDTGITLTAVNTGAAGNDISIQLVNPGQASQALSVSVAGTDITVNLATDTGTAASGATGVEGNNNGLTWTAQQVGTDGNDIVIVLEDPDGNNQSLSISVVGTVIIASLATDGAGAITTTASQLIAAIEADEDASALVSVDHTGNSDGSAPVTDEITQLSGGVDPAPSSTAAQVIAAINNSAEASALVTASNTGSSDGTGTMPAVEQTFLSGGADTEARALLTAFNTLLANLRAAGLMAE